MPTEKLFDTLRARRAMGKIDVQVQINGTKKFRRATLSIIHMPFTMPPPPNKTAPKDGTNLPMVSLQAIMAIERKAPTNQEPIEWTLLTDLPIDGLEDAIEKVRWYSKRWNIELAFREMKSHYRLEQIPSRKAAAVEALVLASLITMMVSKQLLEAVHRRLRENASRLREERWASLLSSVAADVLDVVLLPARAAGVLARRLEPMLLYEAVDPNAKRMSLLQRVDREAMWSR